MKFTLHGGAAVVSFLLIPSAAYADGSNKASAEALFDEGRRLMAAGQFDEACGKLEASQRLDPGVGTMLNLADCYEKSGKTASAWAEFREAVAAARTAGSPDRENIARERAKGLEPKLSYLTIVPWKGQAVVVTRNGTPVDTAALGTAMPVDPGKHLVVAAAPGKREWSTSVQVGAEADRVQVAVPILPDDQGGGGALPLGTGATGQADVTPAGSDPGSTQRTLAITAGAVGIVGLAAGTVFGLMAQSTWSDAKSHCSAYPRGCDAEGPKLKDDADSQATIATVGFVVGAVGLAGGAVLWFTAPKAKQEAGVSAGVGPGSLLVKGTW